jgi:hypothetical protein
MTVTCDSATATGLPDHIREQSLVGHFVHELVQSFPFAVPTLGSVDVPRLTAVLIAAHRLATSFPVLKIGTPTETGLADDISKPEYLAWWMAQLEAIVASEVLTCAARLKVDLQFDTPAEMTVDQKVLYMRAVYCIRLCRSEHPTDGLRAIYEAQYMRDIAQLAEELPTSRGTGPGAPTAQEIWLQVATFRDLLDRSRLS